MPITVEDASHIKSIVSVFETGKAEGDPAAVVVLPDGAGISFGLHQATDRAGSLDDIVRKYIDRRGIYAPQLAPFVDELERDASAYEKHPFPAWLDGLMATLAEAGRRDPLMLEVQHEVFDENYWTPAKRQAREMELQLPLAWGLVYDSCIHSGPRGVWRIRRKFPEMPPARGGDEKVWCRAYATARFKWLGSHPKPIVKRTRVRMREFLRLMDEDNWHLKTPFTIRGVTVGSPLPPAA